MFEKQMKKMKMSDWALAKLGIVAFVLFVIGIWPAFRNWVINLNPWIFFVISIVSIGIVQARIWKKK